MFAPALIDPQSYAQERSDDVGAIGAIPSKTVSHSSERYP